MCVARKLLSAEAESSSRIALRMPVGAAGRPWALYTADTTRYRALAQRPLPKAISLRRAVTGHDRHTCTISPPSLLQRLHLVLLNIAALRASSSSATARLAALTALGGASGDRRCLSGWYCGQYGYVKSARRPHWALCRATKTLCGVLIWPRMPEPMPAPYADARYVPGRGRSSELQYESIACAVIAALVGRSVLGARSGLALCHAIVALLSSRT